MTNNPEVEALAKEIKQMFSDVYVWILGTGLSDTQKIELASSMGAIQDNVDALRARVKELENQYKLLYKESTEAENQEIKNLQSRVKELEALAKHAEPLSDQFDRHWECEKCGYIQYNKIINVQTGQVGVSETENQHREVCPNDGKNLIWVERQISLREIRMTERMKEIAQESWNLQSQLSRMEEALEKIRDGGYHGASFIALQALSSRAL